MANLDSKYHQYSRGPILARSLYENVCPHLVISTPTAYISDMALEGTLRNVGLVVVGLTLMACAGIFPEGTNPIGPGDGVRFSANNPNYATPGAQADVLIEALPSLGESGQNYTLSVTASNGATVTPSSIAGVFANGSGSNLHTVRLTVPAGLAAGARITVTAQRTTTGSPVAPRTYEIPVQATGISASFDPPTVEAPVGGNATSTLRVTPNGMSGTVSLLGLVGDVVVQPTTLTIPAGSSTPVTAQVTYRVPASAAIDVPIPAPVRVTLGFQRTLASFSVVPKSSQNQASFDLSVSPSSILVSGGQVPPVTVTVTPRNGFTGPVTLNFSLPGQGALTVNPNRGNPVTLQVSGTAAVSRQITFVYTAGFGAPIGTATVQATGGGVNRSATFQVNASRSSPLTAFRGSDSLWMRRGAHPGPRKGQCPPHRMHRLTT